MLKLYYTPGTCALASHITLAEVGADYEASRIDFSTGQQSSPDYLSINPKGRVPALVTDRGVLTETPAILFYLAQSFPDANMAPLDDPHAIAELQSFNSFLCSTVHVLHSHKGRGHRWADETSSFEDMKRRVTGNMLAAFEQIEAEFFKGPWVMGDTYTIADPYLFTISGWLKGDGVDIDQLPKTAEFRQRMKDRPAVAKVMADETA
jgi:glutathione S-transferase